MKTTAKISFSQAVESITYDDASKVLTIQMTYDPPKSHGEVIKYANVPKNIFEAFQNAESKGRYYNMHIRNDYPLVN